MMNMRVRSSSYLVVIVLIIGIGSYMISCNQSSQAISNNISFKDKLSAYELFSADMSALNPAAAVEVIDIGSTLFTDYAEKQRLLKIPPGKKVIINGDGLPIFPDGSIIAKTFYYSRSQQGGRQIIETRLLILKDKKWNAATYRWAADQTDATLLTEGAIVPVTFEDHSGKNSTLAYKIPSQNDCSSCHRVGNELSPIGPKAANLNISLKREGIAQNQLSYLINKGIFEHADITSISTLPDYNDTSLSIAVRARAYLDINCAHCHQSSGMASNTSIQLGYTTSFDETGIDFNKQNMLIRMSTMGEFHMPKTGTTILDDEGIKLIKSYIHHLGKQQKND